MKNGIEIARDHFREIIEGKKRQKNLKRLREYAFKKSSNFAEVLTLGSELIKRNPEASKNVVRKMLENAPSTVKESEDQRIMEAICRIRAVLAICGQDDDADFRSLTEKFLIPFKPEEEGEIFFAFRDGIQGPTKSYSVSKRNEDEAIFQMIADMEESEFGASVVSRATGESIFASFEDLKRCFNSPPGMKDKIREREEKLAALKRKSWGQIREKRHWGIRPGGKDKVLISEDDLIKKLDVEFLCFIQEAVQPPGVGIEIILGNGKIVLAKINKEGQLLAPWKVMFPEAASLMHAAMLLYLRDLTVGKGDTFLRVRRTKKVSGTEEVSPEVKVKEYLVARKEIQYIPRRYVSSTPGERVRKIKRGPMKFPYRIDHPRWLPDGCKASPEALARAKEKGFDLLPGQTYVREHIAEGISTIQKIPERIFKDVSAARELREVLT